MGQPEWGSQNGLHLSLYLVIGNAALCQRGIHELNKAGYSALHFDQFRGIIACCVVLVQLDKVKVTPNYCQRCAIFVGEHGDKAPLLGAGTSLGSKRLLQLVQQILLFGDVCQDTECRWTPLPVNY